jgi:hypothetical protein
MDCYTIFYKYQGANASTDVCIIGTYSSEEKAISAFNIFCKHQKKSGDESGYCQIQKTIMDQVDDNFLNGITTTDYESDDYENILYTILDKTENYKIKSNNLLERTNYYPFNRHNYKLEPAVNLYDKTKDSKYIEELSMAIINDCEMSLTCEANGFNLGTYQDECYCKSNLKHVIRQVILNNKSSIEWFKTITSNNNTRNNNIRNNDIRNNDIRNNDNRNNDNRNNDNRNNDNDGSDLIFKCEHQWITTDMKEVDKKYSLK